MLREQISEIPRRLKQNSVGGEQSHLTMAYRVSPFEPIMLETPPSGT